MPIRAIGMTVEEEFDLDGEKIYAGRYAGKEISRKSVNHAGGMLVTYEMQYGSATQTDNGSFAVVKEADVTEHVEAGRIKLDD